MLFSLVATTLAAASIAAAETITVKVGGQGGAPTFSPNNVTAKVNDVVVFQFSGSPGNHTVTQSSLASPCEPIQGGFDSGWVAVPANVTDASVAPTFALTITNADVPIWYYCKQLNPKGPKPHCELGMVGVINLGSKSFEQFTASAAAATTVGQSQGGLSGINAFATALPSPVAAGSSSGAPASSSSGAPGGDKKNGAVSFRAGGMVAGIAGVAAAALML
ncbi:hypothetical protein MIND_01324600 [Mycena indigotica]|uniref:Extracellular serine-rich protein n=1 Tax=Mycena indigotica TaxID=2126181 RepID=A0A8H6VR94_9AGAR|nr:uncharacterized protein MIND_01324600 [Mycena indigotica]KAF7290834.1 hypothetical protein MIND_01324600 [Mycena indigotica]